MSVSVLGTLVVDGAPISPRERAVLAALVLRAGDPLAPGDIADAIWGEEPPATWTKQVQIAIARLRRHEGVPPIETLPDGYRLNVTPDSVDALRFERLVQVGIEHARDGEPDRAESAFSQSLELWRGRAFADLPDWAPAVAESQRLVDLRASAEEGQLQAQLDLGHDVSIVSRAERLVQDAPLRERRWGILAIALYRGGRQAEALATIREARRRFGEELGIDLSDELAGLEQSMLRHDTALTASSVERPDVEPTCPYRGLAAYDVGDEEEFFGRSGDILSALARIDGAQFLALAGASGCGKSSLVRAGVTPALRRQRRRVEILLPRRTVASDVQDRFASLRVGDVLVVDQFEELLHQGLSDDAIDETCAALAGYMHRGGTVLVTVRSDFLDDCARLPHLGPAFIEGVHLVPAIGMNGLREAIEGPARLAGLRLQPGLTELILRDAAGQAGALPLVSHALVETWLRREGSTLTVAGYEAAGGLSGAIAQSADRLYQRMTPAERTLCRSTLLRLVALGPDGSPIRRTMPVKSLHDDEARDHVLAMLEGARLVSADETSIIVSHESLAVAWPRLRGWLDEDADAQRTMHSLSTAAESWDVDGRPDEDLFRGGRLQTALELRSSSEGDLTKTESQFLDASEALEASDRRELAAREQQERRQNWRLRVVLGVAVGLIVLLAGAGSVAVVSSQEANAQRDSATIEALVATSLALRTSERDVSALLAAEAYRRWPDDPRTRSALMSVLQAAGGFLGTVAVASGGNAYGSVIPGTEQLLVVTTAGDAGVRDAGSGDVIVELDLGFDPGPATPTPLVEVSGDGRVGAVLWPVEVFPDGAPGVRWESTRSDLVVFDLERAERIWGPTRLEMATGALAVNRDGSSIAVADLADGDVTLVSTSDWQVLDVAWETSRPLAFPANKIYPHTAALAFDDRGRLLVGRLDDHVDMVDPASAMITATMAVPELSAHTAMAVSDSGIVIASGDFGLIAFEPDEQRVVWSTDIGTPNPESCNWLALSEPMQRVYCASRFGRISVFDLANGAPIPAEDIRAPDGDIGTLDVSADGAVLTAINGSQPNISRWRLDGLGLARRLIAPGHMLAGPYSYEGSSVATAPQINAGSFSRDELKRVFEATEGVLEGVVVLDTATRDVTYRFDQAVGGVGWAANRRLYAVSDEDHMFRIVDADTGDEVGSPVWGIETVWPSSDGTTLHAVRHDGLIQDLDPRSGDAEGEPWDVEGHALRISVAPDGDRIAVTHSSPPSKTWLAILAAEGHHLLYREPTAIDDHVMLDDGELLGMEGTRMGRYQTDPLARVATVPGGAAEFAYPSLSRDARTLLVMADDGTALLYDTDTGIRIGGPFPTDDRPVAPGIYVDLEGTDVTFPLPDAVIRPDGREMALSMPEGVVAWDIDPEHQFEYVCRIAGRDLTDNEWRTYLGTLGDRQSTCRFGSD
ncbi:BTAD domain-containing putative transcriptional regulator [Agromyces sp. NPDC057865]|uniref:nSTAND1 domain-containing NTPase n=1 Tax=Agromyces sp. NPDC057865 TaxID=3346267 RepID=UPI003671AA56